MGNWFTSVKLFLELLARDIWACGTLHSDQRGFQHYLKDVKLLHQGDSNFAQSSDLVISVWGDKAKMKPVKVLSMMYQAQGEDTVTRRKNISMQSFETNRPPNTTFYCKFLGGVDHSNQNQSYYPVQSWRNVKWWKYIFYFLLDVSIINAWILRNKVLEATSCIWSSVFHLPKIWSVLPVHDRMLDDHKHSLFLLMLSINMCNFYQGLQGKAENYILAMDSVMSFYAKGNVGKSGTANLWMTKNSLNFVTS